MKRKLQVEAGQIHGAVHAEGRKNLKALLQEDGYEAGGGVQGSGDGTWRLPSWWPAGDWAWRRF